MSTGPAPAAETTRRAAAGLFVVSFLALYAELIAIRWLASEIRVFAYFKNLPLMASFLGLGLGMLHPRKKALQQALPLLFGVLVVVTAYAEPHGLIHLRFPDTSVALWTTEAAVSAKQAALFLGVILALFFLVVAALAAVGSRLAEHFDRFPPLQAYSINVAGSLAGIVGFSLLSLGEAGPVAWIGIFALLVLYFDRSPRTIVALAVTLACVAFVPREYRAERWSPYYRIDLNQRQVIIDDVPYAAGWNLDVNHDYHQRMLDLSERFLSAHPVVMTDSTYQRAVKAYTLPFAAAGSPGRVLVVGAGTGNDVAAALRAGAASVDAVEIDPVILELGRKLHPERPYDHPGVRAINADARAWFRQSKDTYDLIVFGLLDSHTMFSSLSSLRLDNYVYTVESFRDALRRLSPEGVMAVSFSRHSGDWIAQRMINTLRDATGEEPLSIYNGYDDGVTFFAGPGLPAVRARLAHEPTYASSVDPATVRPSTDAWPFLYVKPGARPTAYLLVLGSILGGALLLVRRTLRRKGAGDAPFDWTLFFMGAGFMLVEVKSVAELSLLFGSTWLVNSAVFSAILLMILAANRVVGRAGHVGSWPWIALGASLVLPLLVPLASLNALAFPVRAALGSLLAALPILFSGILFATLFRRHAHPSAGLAANLLGALVGGVLEYSSMLLGIPALNLLALAIYALAFVASRRGAGGAARGEAALA